MPKINTMKACSYCAKEVYKLASPAKGLCAACYYRERRNGTLASQRKERPPCSVDGCDRPHAARGYCSMHLKRIARGRPLEGDRYEKWGHRDKHPLAHTYYHMRRQYKGQVDQTWLDDFWRFVSDVGEKPTERHKLFRIDSALPYQAGNTEWRCSEISTDSAKEYARLHRTLNPDRYKNTALKKSYGIDLAKYNQMHAEQGGVCAICSCAETAIIRGNLSALAVDHCHSGGQVRALLCSACNTALGLFRDDPTLLRAGARYLEKHALLPPSE